MKRGIQASSSRADGFRHTGAMALALFLSVMVVIAAHALPAAGAALTGSSHRANFRGEAASIDARRVANWAVSSGDTSGLPFVVIDKVQAKVFVFDRVGRLRGATLALLGSARGDDTTPGIGDQRLKTIRPDERTTPAGRFVAFLGRDLETDILWIDYGTSLSMHRVITGNPGDHRRQRLATASPEDKRISYGCINVPVKFYEDIVVPSFAHTRGVVYILPESKTVEEVFTLSNADALAGK